ncbi:MAG TPA: rhodanese-like domain-containing protein [bacterium]|nr:rhodanese-like domain-containing protein [bacterium]
MKNIIALILIISVAFCIQGCAGCKKEPENKKDVVVEEEFEEYEEDTVQMEDMQEEDSYMVYTVYSEEVDELVGNGAKIIDVREADEVKSGPKPIPGSILIPMRRIQAHLRRLDLETTYIIASEEESISRRAGMIMARAGFNQVFVLEDGIDAYWRAHVDITPPELNEKSRPMAPRGMRGPGRM